MWRSRMVSEDEKFAAQLQEEEIRAALWKSPQRQSARSGMSPAPSALQRPAPKTQPVAPTPAALTRTPCQSSTAAVPAAEKARVSGTIICACGE